MCDYSLHGVSFRPAKVGDQLITTQFWNTPTRFSAADEPRVAVCLLPGTEVSFRTKSSAILPGSSFSSEGRRSCLTEWRDSGR